MGVWCGPRWLARASPGAALLPRPCVRRRWLASAAAESMAARNRENSGTRFIEKRNQMRAAALVAQAAAAAAAEAAAQAAANQAAADQADPEDSITGVSYGGTAIVIPFSSITLESGETNQETAIKRMKKLKWRSIEGVVTIHERICSHWDPEHLQGELSFLRLKM